MRFIAKFLLLFLWLSRADSISLEQRHSYDEIPQQTPALSGIYNSVVQIQISSYVVQCCSKRVGSCMGIINGKSLYTALHCIQPSNIAWYHNIKLEIIDPRTGIKYGEVKLSKENLSGRIAEYNKALKENIAETPYDFAIVSLTDSIRNEIQKVKPLPKNLGTISGVPLAKLLTCDPIFVKDNLLDFAPRTKCMESPTVIIQFGSKENGGWFEIKQVESYAHQYSFKQNLKIEGRALSFGNTNAVNTANFNKYFGKAHLFGKAELCDGAFASGTSGYINYFYDRDSVDFAKGCQTLKNSLTSNGYEVFPGDSGGPIVVCDKAHLFDSSKNQDTCYLAGITNSKALVESMGNKNAISFAAGLELR